MGQRIRQLDEGAPGSRATARRCSTTAAWRRLRLKNHPTEEHLLPLYVAMGAAGPAARATQLHASFEHGILAMDAYAFD
jgi:aromatic ring-opening dioxygenase catalytic subunit (LigB family)